MKKFNTLLLVGLISLSSASLSAQAFDASRVTELRRQTCKLTMVQTYPEKSTGYESKFDVKLVDYKVTARGPNGELGETLYFSKLIGLSFGVRRPGGRVDLTQKYFVSKMRPSGAAPDRNASGDQSLFTQLLDQKNPAAVETVDRFVLTLRRSAESSQAYSFKINHEKGKTLQLYYRGVLRCH